MGLVPLPAFFAYASKKAVPGRPILMPHAAVRQYESRCHVICGVVLDK